MTTFKHAGNPGFKLQDTRTGQVITFSGGTHETTDENEIALLRAADGVTEEQTKDELLEQAKTLGVEGASKLNKGELEKAVADAQPPAVEA